MDIINIVHNIKYSERKDLDGNSLNLMKCVIDIIASLFSCLIKGYMEIDVFPDVLKISQTKLASVYIKGSCSELSSYIIFIVHV